MSDKIKIIMLLFSHYLDCLLLLVGIIIIAMLNAFIAMLSAKIYNLIYCKYNGFNIAVGYLKYCRYYRNDCISHLELIHNIIKFQTEWNR